MTVNMQPGPESVLLVLWLGMLGSPVTLWITLVVLDKLSILQKIQSGFGDYFFYIGLLFILPAILLLRLFKAANKTYLNDLQRSVSGADGAYNKFRQTMIIGMAVADVPATVAVALYFLSGDLDKSVLLVASSFILCFLFKPELRSRS
jgi:hypothetical protein